MSEVFNNLEVWAQLGDGGCILIPTPHNSPRFQVVCLKDFTLAAPSPLLFLLS